MSGTATWQLAWALVLVLLVFVLAAGTKRILAIGVLLVLIPFQTIETRYGSSSVLMAYALAIVLLFNGGLKVRMLPEIGLIVLAYLVSLSQASRIILSLHVVYLFQFFSCFVIFLLAYNYARLVERERTVIDLLFAINVLNLLYCALQLAVGPGNSFSLFGLEALSTNSNREIGDARLVGAFGIPGATAGYFVLMTLACAVELMFAQGGRRLMVQLLAALNMVGLVATANRGGFLVLMAMFPVLLFVFRKELGVRRVLQYAIGGIAVLTVASATVITYTDFDRMFARMSTVTETENGIPDTRQKVWPVAIEKIKKDPWLGEGPFFMYPEAAEKLGWPRGDFDNYPHSLYLYLLRTVGVIGLAAILWFFAKAWVVIYAASIRESNDAYTSALLRLGLLLIPAFLLDQARLEFPRPSTMDYAQFIFALLGLLIGVGDRQGRRSQASEPALRSDEIRGVRLAEGGSGAR